MLRKSLLFHLYCDILTIIGYVSEVLDPFRNDLIASCFNDTHDISQYMLRDMRVVLTYQAVADCVIYTFVAFSVGFPSEICTWIGSRGLFSFVQK